MIARNIALVVAGFLLVTACAAHEAAARQEALLNVGQGQIPNDTGSDGATTMTIEECKELGGKALKVVFAKGDSFGDRQARVRELEAVRQPPVQRLQSRAAKSALDPHGQAQAHDELPDPRRFPLRAEPRQERGEDRHRRIDERERLGAGPVGRGQVVLCLRGRGDAHAVLRRHLAGGRRSAGRPGSRRPAAVAGPAPVYRIKGTIGAATVDLTATPEGAAAAAPAKKGTIGGDPARLARIRAAKMPPITKPILFCTPEADAICSALEVFPADNPWNQVVSDWPLHPNSKNIIASIGAAEAAALQPRHGLHPRAARPAARGREDRGLSGRIGQGPVPRARQHADRRLARHYQRQRSGKPPTLDDVQRDVLKQDGDRHASVVDPVNRMLYEFYQMKKTDRGWQAAQCVDLRSEVEPAAARRLDLDRRRRAADLPGHGALRRDPAGHRRARHARDGGQDPPGLRGARHALCQPA